MCIRDRSYIFLSVIHFSNRILEGTFSVIVDLSKHDYAVFVILCDVYHISILVQKFKAELTFRKICSGEDLGSAYYNRGSLGYLIFVFEGYFIALSVLERMLYGQSSVSVICNLCGNFETARIVSYTLDTCLLYTSFNGRTILRLFRGHTAHSGEHTTRLGGGRTTRLFQVRGHRLFGGKSAEPPARQPFS